MTDAPERIWASVSKGKVGTILTGHSHTAVSGWHVYVPEAALAEAEARGYARAVEDAPADPVAEAARVLANIPVEHLIAATERALHEMGKPRPKDSKQDYRAYFVAVCRALAQKGGY